MNRNEMIEALMPAVAERGEALAPARRRLWRMSAPALRRELLMRGLVEYDDPLDSLEDEQIDEQYADPRALLGVAVPVYVD